MDDSIRPIRHTTEFWDHYGVTVATHHEPSDIIFFSRNGSFPTHMGIVIDEDHFVHAPGVSDSSVGIEKIVRESIDTSQTLGRILFTHNPIGYKTPTIAMTLPSYRHHQQLP